MSELSTELLKQLALTQNISALRGIRRGIERETLRVTPKAQLAQTDHPKDLGSALTHANITTDYAESLLEFITPVSDCTDILLNQLSDIHTHVTQTLHNEMLWPMSMPCVIAEGSEICIAKYGTSNLGQMKMLYRQGLHHRYGSKMQVIAGVHYNFSMPDRFWNLLQKLSDDHQPLQDFISERYLGLIRNFYRYGWLIPYLFGASPSLCSSFIKGDATQLPFESFASGALYLPHATSLRMSNLGYTSSAQSKLSICHNSLQGYIQTLKQAIATREPEFTAIGVYRDGVRQQLNDHILQIENELYAPIRPKRTTKSGETPLEALNSRGIEYIEVRSLDINPFDPLGIGETEIRFLDQFLLWCLLSPSPALNEAEIQVNRSNFNSVVLHGRQEDLKLLHQGQPILLRELAIQIFDEMKPLATLLDRASCCPNYQPVWHSEREKLEHPEQTPSARLLRELELHDGRMSELGLELAKQHREQLLNRNLHYYDEHYFSEEAERSLTDQRLIEGADRVSFEDYLADYFERIHGKQTVATL